MDRARVGDRGGGCGHEDVTVACSLLPLVSSPPPPLLHPVVSWVTGHSYIVYGPLALGATTFMFESTPLYPDHNRYWQMVERHKLTTLYTAPTAIRALMRFPTVDAKKCDRSSLRVLGSVGEPINPEGQNRHRNREEFKGRGMTIERNAHRNRLTLHRDPFSSVLFVFFRSVPAWKWYFDVAGSSQVPIVDSYWQTESGGHLLTPFPGCTPMKPGSATLPFFGVEPIVLTPEGGARVEGNDVSGVLAIARPFPGLARTIYGDHARYLQTYMAPYPGYYFTGDGVFRDRDGYYWITGRVDDVMS